MKVLWIACIRVYKLLIVDRNQYGNNYPLELFQHICHHFFNYLFRDRFLMRCLCGIYACLRTF